MSKTDEVVGTEWKAVCAQVGSMAIKLAALKREIAQLEADIDRAAYHGMSLDMSAHWAGKVEALIAPVEAET